MDEQKHDTSVYRTKGCRSLYARWCRLHKSEFGAEFKDYEVFYEWSLAAGYKYGALLLRRNPELPHSPDNSYWEIPGDVVIKGKMTERWVALWNETVNRIRLHYGLPPVEEAHLAEEAESSN